MKFLTCNLQPTPFCEVPIQRAVDINSTQILLLI